MLCNGKVERFNKTLVRMIRAFLKGQQREWDQNLGCLAAAYRATPHETTGLTPNLMMLGREARLPAEIMFGSGSYEGDITSYGEYVDSLRDKMQHAHDVARQHLHTRAKRQHDLFDGKTPLIKFNVGDHVWFLAERRKVGENPKLYLPYEGPFLVVSKMSDLVYIIQGELNGPTKVVNVNKLKLYEGENHLKWAKTALARARKQPVSSEPISNDSDST